MRRLALLSIVLSIGFLPACRRQPEVPPPTPVEEPPTAPSVAPPTGLPTDAAPLPQSVEPSFSALPLPITNAEVGITVRSLPDHLIAAYSDGPDMMLVERGHHPRRVFVSAELGAGPLNAARYHEQARRLIEGYGGGRQTDSGTIPHTPFGAAAWSATHYAEDGTDFDQVELVTPHPNGSGLLYLRARYPEGEATVADKIQELADLLTRIEPATG